MIWTNMGRRLAGLGSRRKAALVVQNVVTYVAIISFSLCYCFR